MPTLMAQPPVGLAPSAIQFAFEVYGRWEVLFVTQE